LPAHVFLSDPDFEFGDLADHDLNWQPPVFSGPFILQEWSKGDQITLARNPDYWKGEPYLDGIVWQVVADEITEVEMLKSGQSDLGDIEPRHLTEMEQVPTLDIYRFLRPEYVYLALQQGDPEDPQPRLNEDGTLNENHGEHPILSSKRVRQALAHAVDRTSIINRVLMGQGAPLHTHIVPLYRWAYHDGLEPRGHDPEKAMEMLEAAGWRDEDGDDIRECHGCGTTEDGARMVLNLRTHIDNEIYEDVGILIQQQLIDVGVEVEFEPMEWHAFQDKLLGQIFDMAIVGWRGVVPDGEAFFDARGDVPGNGFNVCSFYGPDYERLQLKAKTVEGCSYEDRGAAYREIQGIMREEQPYIWLYVPRRLTIINKRLGNVNPGPWSATHNIQEWFIKS
jgi:peptide/nickel transport system substrate-binding protein